MWIRRDDAFTPIIRAEQFAEAFNIIQERCKYLTNEQLLERLKQLLARCGTLSGILIDETDEMPSSAAYRHRFGSLIRAYSLIGYTPARDFSFIDVNRDIRMRHARLTIEIVAELRKAGANVDQDPHTDILRINQEFTASLVLVRCRETPAHNLRWLVRLDNSLDPDVTIAARLRPGNQDILDYYLLPGMDCLAARLQLARENGVVLDVYRFENLSFFHSMARRVLIGEAA
jgi:hypothetical protein